MLQQDGKQVYEDGVRNVEETFRQANFTQTHVEEARLLAKPWPFTLEEVRAENMKLFYGTLDVNVPIEVGEMIRDAMGGRALLRIVDGATHATMPTRAVEWIREVLGLEEIGTSKDEDKTGKE